jgi:hypothetical protein
VNVEDSFGPWSFTLVKPHLFCNPVNKNGEGISDPSAHLTCYKRPLFTTFERKPNPVTAMDQFGEQALDLRSRPSNLCVPSLDITESLGQPAGASVSALGLLPAIDVDHFNLYWAKTTPRTPRFERRQVNLVDQWIDQDVLVARPVRFGVPADKEKEGIIDEESHLTCYALRKTAKFDKRDVDIENRFGQERLTVTRPHMLCVPSEVAGTEDDN